MSQPELKRFDIVSGQIQRVYEFDDGRWESDRIEPDESYTLSGTDVLHVERDDGWLETTVYRDLEGSGTFQEISTSYSRPDQWLPDASDQALARLYMAVFDRSPDEGGFRYWDQQMDQGMPFNDVAASFINSNEFSQTYGTLNTSGFVDQLYLNVLNRTADADGLNWWVAQLENGVLNRQEVVTGFSESAEFAALSANAVDGFLQLVGQPVVVDNGF
ncbi:DUF4214 domain-containing protein [Pseudomonas triticifolii]|uniref:DUF4214 domain-containing protein n=1 Tax=Pseudomonas triticifolii TaxID=2762592 RepID=A0ABR7BHB6_9PSED|nr:DUF4214 domain-containing protein [Pseudomonas triticifolii]MBC3956578.1 DUF4214 domain-containing protein [Pseudomonas triticifolii]